MLKRKRRKGFWWYSWILVLLAIGGTVGGYFYANKLWEEGPKEYRSTAMMKVEIRKPFSSGKEDSGSSGLRNSNESEALRVIRGLGTMRPVMRSLNLTNRWVLSDTEALQILSESVDADLGGKSEISITVTRDSAQEAAELANAVTAQAVESLKTLDEKKKSEGLALLDKELAKAREPINKALTAAADALKANGLSITPTVKTDLKPFMEIEEVLVAQVDLEGAKERLRQAEREQATARDYWERTLAEPEIVQEAVAPAKYSGPEKDPIQMEWSLYGLTAGLIVGLMLMFVLWKLFSPKRN